MLFLVDANVLIDAHRDYYPIERVPEFWGWLAHLGTVGKLKVPIEIFEEVAEGADNLATWIKLAEIKGALLLDAESDPSLVTEAVSRGYAPDLSDDEVPRLGRDPFLLGHALRNPARHCVVTTEVSKPSRLRANRHLPDAARSLGVACCNTFELLRRLDFRTNWRS